MRNITFHVWIFLIVTINILSFMKFNDNLFYFTKFIIVCAHFLLLFFHLIRQKMNVSPSIKWLSAIFYCWTVVMCFGLMNSSTYTQFFNSLLSIGSYVLLFFYSILLLPNYMKRKQIDYLSFVKTVFYAIAICMAFAVAAGFTDPKAFHFDPFSLRNRYLGFFSVILILWGCMLFLDFLLRCYYFI